MGDFREKVETAKNRQDFFDFDAMIEVISTPCLRAPSPRLGRCQALQDFDNLV